MVLPLYPNEVSLYSVYADRITLNVRVVLTPNIMMERIYGARSFLGFIGTQRKLMGYISDPRGGNPYRISISRPRRNEPFNVLVDVGALARIRNNALDYAGERGASGSVNWLHPNQVRNSEALWWDIDEQISNVVEAIREFFISHRVFLDVNDVALGRITYSQIEACVDMAAERTGQAVAAMTDGFIRRFRHVDQRRYATRNAQSVSMTDINCDRLMVTGYGRKDERIKMYEKTNRRIRLEISFGNTKAMRRVSHEIEWHPLEVPFPHFFLDYARYAATQFNSVLSGVPLRVGQNPTAVDLLFHLAAATNGSLEEARSILNALMYHGRIYCPGGGAGEGATSINRLIERQVLELHHVEFVVARRRYQLALEELREMDGLRLNPFRARTGRS